MRLLGVFHRGGCVACVFTHLTAEQVAFGEDFHAGGAVIGNESPARAVLDRHQRAPLEDVVHKAGAVSEGGDDEGEGVVVVGVGEPSVVMPCSLHLGEVVLTIRGGGGEFPRDAPVWGGGVDAVALDARAVQQPEAESGEAGSKLDIVDAVEPLRVDVDAGGSAGGDDGGGGAHGVCVCLCSLP